MRIFCTRLFYNLDTEDFISKKIPGFSPGLQAEISSLLLTAYSRLRDLFLAIYMDMHLRIGESPSICPFPKNNGDEAPKLSELFSILTESN